MMSKINNQHVTLLRETCKDRAEGGKQITYLQVIFRKKGESARRPWHLLDSEGPDPGSHKLEVTRSSRESGGNTGVQVHEVGLR